jgi:hypothetical protein
VAALTTAAPAGQTTVSTTATENVGINNIAVWKLMNSGAMSTFGTPTNADESNKAGPLTVPQPAWATA